VSALVDVVEVFRKTLFRRRSKILVQENKKKPQSNLKKEKKRNESINQSTDRWNPFL